MKSTFLGREKNEVKFTVEFTAEEFEAAIQKAYLAERGQIAIPGFRKGKAPRSIIEKKYGSSVFFETAIDEMLKEAYPKALDELKLDPVDSPAIEFGEEKLEQGKGFTVTVKLTVAPEVEVKNYKGLNVEFEPKKAGAKDVKAELENLQHRNARLVDSEAAAKNGDTVVLDYKGFVGEDQFAGGTADGYSLKLGSGTFIPGFEDQLVGVKAGESRDVNVTFPKEYSASNLAGKDAVFKCTVHQVQKEELPELDDEFAKDVSSFDTLDELKKDIKAKLEASAKQQNEYEGKNRAMLALCEANPIDIPQAMIDDEVNQMYNEYIQRLVNQGISAEAVKKYLKESESKLKEGFKADAEARVHTSLLVDEVSKLENISATDEEMDEEFKLYADMYGMELDKVKEAMKDSLDYIKEDVVYKKTVDYIYKQANLIGKKKEAAKKAAKEE